MNTIINTRSFSVVKKIMCFMLAFVTLVIWCMTTVSAVVTKDYKCLGDTKTIKVTTAASGSPYIVFYGEGGTTKNADCPLNCPAPKMSLKVYNHTTGQTYYKWISGKGLIISSKLTLNQSTSYTITVSYLYDKNENWGKLTKAGGPAYGWYNGTWRVNSTNALTSFSIK